MTKVETLTAYSCKFSYLQRNNPLIEEQREAIKEGKKPEYNFSDFIEKYEKYIGEILPQSVVAKRNLVSRQEAVHEMHLPTDFERLKQCRERLAYEELLSVS